MIVISDTTPLLYLSRIGHLEIVRAVHREIVVPKTVSEELVIARPGEPGVASLHASPWIRVNDEIERAGIDPALAGLLDAGKPLRLRSRSCSEQTRSSSTNGRAARSRERGDCASKARWGCSSRHDGPESSGPSGQRSTTSPTQASASARLS
ncbi:hypothetical protein WMF30_02665 [Sorangium sp. So ce134]